MRWNTRLGGFALAIAAVAMVAGAVPADAAVQETVVESAPPTGGSTCGGELREWGQSLTAPIDGWLTEVGLYVANHSSSAPTRDVTGGLRIIEGDGLAGLTLSGPQTVAWHLEAAPDDSSFAPMNLQIVSLDAAVPVSAGDVVTIGLPLDCSFGMAWGTTSYAGGTGYLDQFVIGDLAFRAVFVDSLAADSDGDGVDDAADVCPDTDLDAEADQPSKSLKPNHLWSTAAGFVTTNGAGAFSLEDTGGCSATQIIAAAQLGAGHAKFGISPGAMADWIAALD